LRETRPKKKSSATSCAAKRKGGKSVSPSTDGDKGAALDLQAFEKA